MGEQQQPDIMDQNIDRILRAAGSGLRYYMPSTKDKLRNVMVEIEAEHRATIDALVGALEWALPLALTEQNRARIERIQCGHQDIRGKNASGEIIGLHQSEIDAAESARAALQLARGEKGDE